MKRTAHRLVIAVIISAVLAFHAGAESKPVRVGVYDNRPLVFMGSDGPEGLFIDVLEAVARSHDWKLEYHYASWDASFRDLQAGQLDLLPVVAYSEERARHIQFSDNTLIANWGELHTRRGLDVKSITDLQDRTIAYMHNDTHSLFFMKLLDTLVIGHTTLVVDSYTDMLAALENGNADAGVFNHIQASLAMGNRAIQVTPIVFNPIQIRFAAPRGDPAAVLSGLDSYVAGIQSGEEKDYHQMIEHWLGEVSQAPMPNWVWSLVIAGLVSILLVLGLNLWLHRMVHTRTIDLEASNRALRESENRYRTILSSAMDGYLLVDQCCKVVETNEAYMRMSGYSADELASVHVSELDAKDNPGQVAERLARVTQKGQDRFESTHRRKDGSLYDVEVSLQYHPDNPEHLISFVRDISERKRFDKERLQAEQALREQAEYQQAIFNYSPLAMFSMDLDGRVISCNNAAERTFGWTIEEIAGSALPLIPANRQEEFQHLKDQIAQGSTISGIELVRIKKNGESLDVRLWSAPIYNDNHQIIGLISFYDDISERKAIDEKLRRNLAEKQILLREVHHRVKNNLSVISSLLNLQSATITNPEQAIEAFRNSRDRIMAMALVHMELYETGDFARIDMGTYLGNLSRQIALVNENAGQVSLISQADSLMLDLQVAVPCGLILNELITNAYKYASRAGKKAGIEVSMARTRDASFTITVSDNGPGLPAGYEASGSLGLTLVRLLVGQIDGTMVIDSSETGTVIRISFPDPSLV